MLSLLSLVARAKEQAEISKPRNPSYPGRAIVIDRQSDLEDIESLVRRCAKITRLKNSGYRVILPRGCFLVCDIMWPEKSEKAGYGATESAAVSRACDFAKSGIGEVIRAPHCKK